jgi:hypothetical protein
MPRQTRKMTNPPGGVARSSPLITSYSAQVKVRPTFCCCCCLVLVPALSRVASAYFAAMTGKLTTLTGHSPCDLSRSILRIVSVDRALLDRALLVLRVAATVAVVISPLLPPPRSRLRMRDRSTLTSQVWQVCFALRVSTDVRVCCVLLRAAARFAETRRCRCSLCPALLLIPPPLYLPSAGGLHAVSSPV